jgi:hypothetical protein
MNVNLHLGCVDIPAAHALHLLSQPRHGILRQLLKLVVRKIGASTDLYVATGQPIVPSKPHQHPPFPRLYYNGYSRH